MRSDVEGLEGSENKANERHRHRDVGDVVVDSAAVNELEQPARRISCLLSRRKESSNVLRIDPARTLSIAEENRGAETTHLPNIPAS